MLPSPVDPFHAERYGAVVALTIDRPPVNALDAGSYRRLTTVLVETDADSSTPESDQGPDQFPQVRALMADSVAGPGFEPGRSLRSTGFNRLGTASKLAPLSPVPSGQQASIGDGFTVRRRTPCDLRISFATNVFAENTTQLTGADHRPSHTAGCQPAEK